MSSAVAREPSVGMRVDDDWGGAVGAGSPGLFRWEPWWLWMLWGMRPCEPAPVVGGDGGEYGHLRIEVRSEREESCSEKAELAC